MVSRVNISKFLSWLLSIALEACFSTSLLPPLTAHFCVHPTLCFALRVLLRANTDSLRYVRRRGCNYGACTILCKMLRMRGTAWLAALVSALASADHLGVQTVSRNAIGGCRSVRSSSKLRELKCHVSVASFTCLSSMSVLLISHARSMEPCAAAA